MHLTPIHQHSWLTSRDPAEAGKIDEILMEVRAIREDARIARIRDAVVHGEVDTELTSTVVGVNSDSRDFSTDAPVYDSDNDLQIMGILGVNAKAGWVLVADLPMEMTKHGHIKSRRLRFKKIIQFERNDQGPGSFHCYGRLPDGKEAQ